MRELFDRLKKRVVEILKGEEKKEIKLKEICKLLKGEVPHYDWVGFYFVNPDDKRELILGPFEGEDTEHVRIPFGKGICGQAAERKRLFVVQDVSKESNYLSCSPLVKAEIVVPLFDRKGEIVGELDIDSHELSPFTEEDREFLKEIALEIKNYLF